VTNKRLKIENLDNLQELNPEEVFSIQGGGAELKASELSVEPQGLIAPESLIYVDPENPKPYPLPIWPPYPCKPYPINPYPIKGKEGTVLLHQPLLYCPVIL
jgi:hypothetical protein